MIVYIFQILTSSVVNVIIIFVNGVQIYGRVSFYRFLLSYGGMVIGVQSPKALNSAGLVETTEAF